MKALVTPNIFGVAAAFTFLCIAEPLTVRFLIETRIVYWMPTMTNATSRRVTPLAPLTETRTVATRVANDLARGRKYLTRDEVRQLVKTAKDNRYGARDALMIQMTYEHGALEDARE